MATAAVGMCRLGRVRMSVVMFMLMGMSVPMVVAVSVVGHMAAVGAAFGLERQICFHHGHVHAAQHVGQHMVGFDLEVVGLQLDGHMAVAQVVGSARQVERRAVRRARRDAQHGLRRGDDADERTVLGHQHITAAHHAAARQEHSQRPTL